jgi:hypothetical protein
LPKYIAVSRCTDYDRAASRTRFLREVAPLKLEHWAGLRRYVVDLVDVEPNFPDSRPGPYDIVEEAWFETGDDLATALECGVVNRGAQALISQTYVYQVSERVQMDDRRGPHVGERSPGVKAIYLVRRNEQLNDQEARQRWKDHAPLAKAHHAGMSRYVQNGVIAALTAGAPTVNGIAELHFPTQDDLEQRLYDSEQGRDAIRADVSTLVAESVALYTSEYVLRV